MSRLTISNNHTLDS